MTSTKINFSCRIADFVAIYELSRQSVSGLYLKKIELALFDEFAWSRIPAFSAFFKAHPDIKIEGSTPPSNLFDPWLETVGRVDEVHELEIELTREEHLAAWESAQILVGRYKLIGHIDPPPGDPLLLVDFLRPADLPDAHQDTDGGRRHPYFLYHSVVEAKAIIAALRDPESDPNLLREIAEDIQVQLTRTPEPKELNREH